MHIIDIRDTRLCVTESGDPHGRPLVFANALGTDARVWDRLLPLLPEGLRFIRYDMRGHGLSDAPPGDYYMGDLVGEAAGLMDHLGIRDAVFVGLSIGGVVAQGLAAERPDLLRGLVLSNTAAKIGTPDSWNARVAQLRADGIEALAETVLERWFSRRFRAGNPDTLAGFRHMLTRTPRDGYVGCCAALAETDLRDSTATLRLPVLGIAGSEDGSTPADLVRETIESIARGRLALIPGVGHLPCVEAPARVAALIAGFLDEIDQN